MDDELILIFSIFAVIIAFSLFVGWLICLLYQKNFMEELKAYWFIGAFIFLFACIGFSFWQIIGAILFGIVGFFISICIEGTLIDKKTNSKKANILKIAICVITLIISISCLGNNLFHFGGSYWDNYDYDDDGNINQNEWEDALGDYMDNIMD